MVVTAAGLVIYRVMSSSSIQYLMMHATSEEHLWTPPKGHQDPGEDLRQCAIRETVEECGLREGVDYKISPDWSHCVNYQAYGKPKSVTYYLAQVFNPEAKITLSSEHRAHAWCDIDRAVELARFKESIDVLQAAHGYIQSCLKRQAN